MKANELRIGNLVQYKDTKELTYIYQIEHRFKDVYRINDINNNPNLEPIPLTEEVLQKIGFVYFSENNDGSFNYWNKEQDCSIDVEIDLNDKEIELGFRYRICERKRTKSIVYIHQLQNLYFSLTDKELTINI